MNKLLRHYARALSTAAFLSLLAACSSTPSVQDSVAEAEQIPDVSSEQLPDVPVAAEEAESFESNIDLSIEANLDEVSERTQRRYDAVLAAMRSENWLQAELELDQLIADEPGFPGAWVNRALVYEQQGRSGEARQALEQALAIAPGFPPANNELGRILREDGEFAAAELAYRRSLDTDPNNAIAHLNLGILLDVYLRRPSDALAHYNQYQATRIEPDEKVARWIVDLERRATAAERVAQDQ